MRKIRDAVPAPPYSLGHQPTTWARAVAATIHSRTGIS